MLSYLVIYSLGVNLLALKLNAVRKVLFHLINYFKETVWV